jgi:prevent-host-death family protein
MAAMQVNMLEAKTQLSKLVEAVLRGEEVVIANRGKPVVKLVKAQAPMKRQWGAWEGLMSEAEIEHAFSPEVEAEMAQPWIAELERPLPAGVKPRRRAQPLTSPAAKPAAKRSKRK